MPAKDFNQTAASRKSKKKMSKVKKWSIIGGLSVVALIVGALFFPYYGTIHYGICRTFIEMQEPYPQSVQYINAVEDIDYTYSVSITYKKVDPFGLEAMNEIQCFFEKDKDGNILLKKVDLNGKKRSYPMEDPEVIKKFNVGIQGVIQNPPSLIMPYTLSDDIKDYR